MTWVRGSGAWFAASVLLLFGCAAEATCPEGTSHPPRGDGTFEAACETTCVTSEGTLGYLIDGFVGCRGLCVRADGNSTYCDLLGGPDAGGTDGGPDSGDGPRDGGPCPPCSGGTPVCDSVSALCVQCNAGDDAACSGSTSVCDTEAMECVQCTADDDSACGGLTPACDPDTRECVACVSDADCTSPSASACDTDAHTCVGCSNASDCIGIPGLGRCAAMTCIACSVPTDCDGNACRADGTCSAYPPNRTDCRACDSDRNCESGYGCVAMDFAGTARGAYCLKLRGVCDRPYTIPIGPVTTVSGAGPATYCGIRQDLTTCEAVRALTLDTGCATSPCPEGGLCRTVSALADRCTYACEDNSQCLDSAIVRGATCLTGADRYCSGI